MHQKTSPRIRLDWIIDSFPSHLILTNVDARKNISPCLWRKSIKNEIRDRNTLAYLHAYQDRKKGFLSINSISIREREGARENLYQSITFSPLCCSFPIWWWETQNMQVLFIRDIWVLVILIILLLFLVLISNDLSNGFLFAIANNLRTSSISSLQSTR